MIKVPRKLQAMARRVGAFLVDERGLLTRRELDEARDAYWELFALLQTRPELGIAPPPIMFLLDNLFPRLTVSDLLEARAAWWGEKQIPAAKLVAKEPALLGEKLARIPRGWQPAKTPARLGAIAVELGWITKKQLAAAVKVQRTIKAEVGVRMLLGSLLVALGSLSTAQLFQILALQLGIPFRKFDLASLDRVKRQYLASLSTKRRR